LGTFFRGLPFVGETCGPVEEPGTLAGTAALGAAALAVEEAEERALTPSPLWTFFKGDANVPLVFL
jgi:hypothetical protein